jgi:hypothetical protein
VNIREEELQEIEKQAKENLAYRVYNIEISYNPPNDLEEDCLKLIAEVRRLNELHDMPIAKGLLEENQRLTKELEHIKEKTKHGQAYTVEAEVHYIAHRALQGDG